MAPDTPARGRAVQFIELPRRWGFPLAFWYVSLQFTVYLPVSEGATATESAQKYGEKTAVTFPNATEPAAGQPRLPTSIRIQLSAT
eukprot:scaffold48991_cov63-Phaeocystis_antarctica.AAC.2